jgi:predicted HTH transcriptional regulator
MTFWRFPPGENDSFERKGSRLLDLKLPGVKEDDVLNELAKQLSAISNTGGGRVVYGITNNGVVDAGGVALSVKGRQSTKEWLADVIPKLTEFEIVGFNVYEILPNSGTSGIATGKALFVVDIPDSDRAPHQSKRDSKYYVRLAGKSHPAAHRLIEDIRNRQKHPLLGVSAIQLQIADLPVSIEPFDH